MSIFIESLNEAYVKLHAPEGEIRQLSEKLTFRPPGYQFMPAFKAGYWNGQISLMKKDGIIQKGLVPKVIDLAETCGMRVKVDETFAPFKEKIPFDVNSLNLPFEPYDYQIEAVDRILDKKRQIILSATGSGKSLILYMAVRALEEEPILIIVPTISLVYQLTNDFKDYSVNNGWDVDGKVHQICEGAVKKTNKTIIISTWQSIHRQPKEWFERFSSVLVDEVHGATNNGTSTKSIMRIMDLCENAFIRLGLTGTLNDMEIDELQLIGMFGPIYRVSSTKSLMDRDILTNLDIVGIMLNYPEEIRKKLRGIPYSDEIDFLCKYEPRHRFISNLAGNCKGNTLVLFTRIEHGKTLTDMIKAKFPGKGVHFIYGGTESLQRESVRAICEQKDNVIIVASLKVFSTGVNIKNLHNIILAHSVKSKTTILQSIGRGVRKHESKEVCTFYDICDNLKYGTKKNYSLTHFAARVKTYLAESFKVRIKEIELK